MDVDMTCVHLIALAAAVSHAVAAGSVGLGFGCVLVINALALTVIWSSRNYGPALERELVSRRYPLVGASVFLEAWLAYTRGASQEAAGMALSAWSARLGKPFGATVAALRSQRRSWLRGCANASAPATFPKPPGGVCAWFAREDAAGRPRAWDAPPCEGATVWGAWCSLSGRLPRALAR